MQIGLSGSIFLLFFQVPKDTVIHVWTSDEALVNVVNNGYRVVYSHCWYLDKPKPGVDWVKMYNCDPTGSNNN